MEPTRFVVRHILNVPANNDRDSNSNGEKGSQADSFQHQILNDCKLPKVAQ